MAEGKVTQDFAATFVDQLAQSGLTDVCISPGSRSAPLAMAFARHPGIRVWIHIDERSGSVFAVGMAKATGRPVALLCTSGSAAAEFHPADVLGFERGQDRDVEAAVAVEQGRMGVIFGQALAVGEHDRHAGAIFAFAKHLLADERGRVEFYF